MSKHVVVIASGEIERRSLPHLMAHLQAEDIFVVDVRIPPGCRALSVEMVEKLVKAAWYVHKASAGRRSRSGGIQLGLTGTPFEWERICASGC